MPKALLIALAVDKVSSSDKGRFSIKYLQCRPVLGLLYICSAIESKGIKCDFLDQSVINFSIDDLIDHINVNDYAFVGFYSQLLIKDKLIGYIKAIKKACPKARIIVGGTGYLCYKEFLNNGCDIVCRGEGEATIAEIIDHLEGKKKIEEIDNVVYRKNGIITYNKDREPIKDLDSIPFPSWDKVDLHLYYDYSILPMKRPFIPMTTSRGCPFRCTFCSSTYFWKNNYRLRSVENVLKEIDKSVTAYNIRYIIFQDEAFGIDNNWLRAFCHALTERHYKNLHWMCILHPFTLSQDPHKLIGLMKKAGCNLFVFGLQSANPAILERVNRNPHGPKILKDIIKIADRFDIMTSLDFILGFPGETPDTIRENIDYVLGAKPHLVNFHPLRLEPGSELARDYKDKKICGFSTKELTELCHKANSKFYFRIQNLIRILKFVVKKNPFILFKMAKFYALLKYYLK